MWIFHLEVDGEEGPEDRYVGPFPSEEDLESFIDLYDLDDQVDWYARIVPPSLLLKEFVSVQ